MLMLTAVIIAVPDRSVSETRDVNFSEPSTWYCSSCVFHEELRTAFATAVLGVLCLVQLSLER